MICYKIPCISTNVHFRQIVNVSLLLKDNCFLTYLQEKHKEHRNLFPIPFLYGFLQIILKKNTL